MSRPRTNIPLILSLATLVFGWALFYFSASFILRFVCRQGARIPISVSEAQYSRLSEAIERLAAKRHLRVELRPLPPLSGQVLCYVFVDDATTRDATTSANQLGEEILSEFAQQGIDSPRVTESAQRTPILPDYERGLIYAGQVTGLLVMLAGGNLSLVFFIKWRRQTPPLLPDEQQRRNEAARFDY